jgi:hypothetical protein
VVPVFFEGGGMRREKLLVNLAQLIERKFLARENSSHAERKWKCLRLFSCVLVGCGVCLVSSK